MTISELVEYFVEIGVAQDKAELRSEYAKYNRLFLKMDAVKSELKSREGDARRFLLPLYDHPNMEVRYKAALATLAVAPERARAAIEEISKSGWFPQAGAAGMTLVNLDNGVFKPS